MSFVVLWLIATLSTVLTPASPASAQPNASAALSESTRSSTRAVVSSVSFDGEDVPFPVMAEFVLPGTQVTLEIEADSGARVVATDGALIDHGSNRWTWNAPQAPGAYPIHVLDGSGAVARTINAFVMVPYASLRHGALPGYRIGDYPAPRAKGAVDYSRPLGFVPVTAATDTMLVSPHFRLAQFVCKAGAGYPKYVVLQPTLLRKLERLLAVVHDNGIETETFHVMSGYRTPVYNRAIGNVTTYSRHEYGDAADIYIDENADGRMDDLNHDGRLDRRDAAVLRHWAESLDAKPDAEVMAGGLSDYGASESHGPFVHVDARGSSARW